MRTVRKVTTKTSDTLRKSFLFLFLVGLISGCSKSVVPPEMTGNSKPVEWVSNVKGPTIDAGAIPHGESRPYRLSNGSEILIENRDGKLFFQVEGIFADDVFDHLLMKTAALNSREREAVLSHEIEKIFLDVKNLRGTGISRFPEQGYFTLAVPYQPDLMAPLKSVAQQHSALMNPVSYDRKALDEVKAFGPESEGLTSKPGFRASSKGYSGLSRIHAPEFVALAEMDIGGGVKVDGSSTRVGVTDTGATLNHLNFLSADETHSRVVYMRDFTREGRVYFNNNAKFSVTVPEGAPEEDLVVNAEYISPTPLPKLPSGDGLASISNLSIKVSPELRKVLTTPGSGAKLGILDESVFQSVDDKVDFNGDGKLNGKFYVLLIPGNTAEDDVVYVDLTGNGDFRNVKPLGDWNKTHEVMNAYAEKIGFDFRQETLPSSDGQSLVPVRSVSVVGIDPGNHGTHVCGIIAGRKMVDNDDADTLARGVAPEASLLVNRVCANRGGCNATEALIDLVQKGHVDVVNMSLGGLGSFNDGHSVQETLINRITSIYNVMFMISAGNSGPGRQTVGSPSTARLALSIAATANPEMIQRQYQWPGFGSGVNSTPALATDEDFVLFFSSRGPTAAGGFKPNLSAPGTELSSIQLNAAPGHHAGVDVYWGTSMAAPTATGAYALFLDAIRKYNLKHPDQELTTDVARLREVLLQSARPFDVSRFDLSTGQKQQGQYTWVDQGMGMVDLVAAWKKLFELRDHAVDTAIHSNGRTGYPIELDYEAIVSMNAPNGNIYDGSRKSIAGTPTFGSGVYLDYYGTDTLRQVSIARRLPALQAVRKDAGEKLVPYLVDTWDDFELQTVVYGSDRPWLKAGVLDQLDCATAETADLRITGLGATYEAQGDGSFKLNPSMASHLNICIDREMIRKDLQPGDHGALIFGYRKVGGKKAVLPSFTVPVYLTVPHQALGGSTAYEVQGEVSSFQVSRNYVKIPEGATAVKVTLQVPQVKQGADGLPLQGQSCSGVELMALVGSNISKPIATRPEARISNCTADGTVIREEKLRTLMFTVTKPKPGIWDLQVFGSYKYKKSQYKLRVDYVIARSSLQEIKGGLAALNGSFQLEILESSYTLVPDPRRSSFELFGLRSEISSQVANKGSVVVPNPSGLLRSYGADVKQVKVTTAQSPGNDLDLYVLECLKASADANDPSCTVIATSDGPTDDETVSFTPKPDRVYAVKVEGSAVKDDGKFVSRETISLGSEKGSLAFNKVNAVFEISYSMSGEQIQSSKLLQGELFKGGKYSVVGTLSVVGEDGTLLNWIPVSISAPQSPTPTGN